MDKIKNKMGKLFKWVVNFIYKIIPYGLMIGWFTSCSPRSFGSIVMNDPTMGLVYFALLIVYLVW